MDRNEIVNHLEDVIECLRGNEDMQEKIIALRSAISIIQGSN